MHFARQSCTLHRVDGEISLVCAFDFVSGKIYRGCVGNWEDTLEMFGLPDVFFRYNSVERGKCLLNSILLRETNFSHFFQRVSNVIQQSCYSTKHGCIRINCRALKAAVLRRLPRADADRE